jgi:hypothetical protein
LGEVATVAQRRSDRGDVRLESIRADLELLPRSCGPQPFDKRVRCGLAAAPEGEVQNEFRLALNDDEAVGIAYAFLVGFCGNLWASFLRT